MVVGDTKSIERVNFFLFTSIDIFFRITILWILKLLLIVLVWIDGILLYINKWYVVESQLKYCFDNLRIEYQSFPIFSSSDVIVHMANHHPRSSVICTITIISNNLIQNENLIINVILNAPVENPFEVQATIKRLKHQYIHFKKLTFQ